MLDGALDEAAWREAPMANGFIQNDPREGDPATYDTDVRVLYTEEALYFGVFAHDMEPSKIIVSDLKKDYNTASSDGFRVVLDTFHDGRNAYQFATNPAGAKWDSQMAGEGRDNNANWDGIWDVKTRITETGWFAEIWIPLRTLKFGNEDPQVWGINFERKLRRLNEDSYWSPIPRIYDAQRVSLAGTLEGMRGLHAGKNLRVKPYVLSSGSRITTRPMVGDAQGGLDVKYGVTNGLVWDFTVNTDFSQVEADEQQVNLTRFNLFFPEKRDFFLENQGLFAFGDSGSGGGGGNFGAGRTNQIQDMRLFFTRRLAFGSTAGAADSRGTRLRDVRVPIRRHSEHSAARGSRRPATNFTRCAFAATCSPTRTSAPSLSTRKSRSAVQPSRRLRCELPFRQPDDERIRGEDVFAAAATHHCGDERNDHTRANSSTATAVATDVALHDDR
jgi:hypothetical protein